MSHHVLSNSTNVGEGELNVSLRMLRVGSGMNYCSVPVRAGQGTPGNLNPTVFKVFLSKAG